MWVKWTSLTLVVVVVVITKVHCIHDDPLQSLEPIGGVTSIIKKYKPSEQELYNHTEVKGLNSKEEDVMETLSTTELPEVLPTPVAVKQDKSNSESTDTKSKFSVAKKGVVSKKPSVVPKKEVHFTPSVVAKKGADPESSTPSISPRKGVQLLQGSSLHNLQLASSENMNSNTNFSQLSSDEMNSKNVPISINETQVKTGSEKDTTEKHINYIPNPQLVEKEKFNPTLPSMGGHSLEPVLDSPSTLSPVVLPKSGNLSNLVHFKPTTTDDVSGGIKQMGYAPIIVIVALVVLLVVVVAVGYHRLKEIWARRHYNYVDFLIDGMYE